MNLHQLVKDVSYVLLNDNIRLDEIEVNNITCNSKEVEKGDLFVCLKGSTLDGHDYIEEANRQGAVACVTERKMMLPKGMTGLWVKDSKLTYSQIASAYYGYPADKLKIIGITGTKGKTTVAHMIARMLNDAGILCGLIGTLGIEINQSVIPTKNTTPDAFTIQKYFAKMVDMGCQYVVMEVSSQSIKEKRIEGLDFEIAVFTNFSEDHIGPGEHKTIREYRYYKSQLFKRTKYAIGNLDDIECEYMFRRANCIKYGFTCEGKVGPCILNAENIQYLLYCGTMITRFTVDNDIWEIKMPGRFNVYNALAALSVMKVLGLKDSIQKQCLSELIIRGRMQRVGECNSIACYVDYAHNELSLRSVLKAVKAYNPKRIILVFGCGGNRAKSRRIHMGIAAGENADIIIVTSDNPRYENPKDIISDIVTGICWTNGTYQVVEDRSDAIRYAMSITGKNDILLIAGKGHETYQEVAGCRVPMNDYELAVNAYKEIDRG